MSPDDARHGSTAGYIAGCRCQPCHRAKMRYDVRRRADLLAGKPRTVPMLGAKRRLQALQVLGWSANALAQQSTLSRQIIQSIGTYPTIYTTTHDEIVRLYEALSMTHPPEETPGQRHSVTKVRRLAARRGWAPPLAWEDIDDPAEQPAKVVRRDWHKVARDDVDEVVVERLLALRQVDSTRAEKEEAMRRWTDAGKSIKALCDAHGWHQSRYLARPEKEAS